MIDNGSFYTLILSYCYNPPEKWPQNIITGAIRNHDQDFIIPVRAWESDSEAA